MTYGDPICRLYDALRKSSGVENVTPVEAAGALSRAFPLLGEESQLEWIREEIRLGLIPTHRRGEDEVVRLLDVSIRWVLDMHGR